MIVIASDHAGYNLKNKVKVWLKKQGQDVFDAGADKFDDQDSYVDYAKSAINHFSKSAKADDKLILICGSGVGMSIVANRHKNIRAVLAYSTKQVIQGRKHNNANCLCVGARNTCFLKTKHLIKKFLQTEFLGGKYQKRIDSIDNV